MTRSPSQPTRIGIFHPADPVGHIPGGIETIIRGVLKWAPPDLDYTLFGATSDVAARPIDQGISITLGSRVARFVPVVSADPSAKRGALPLSVRYTWALQRYLRSGRFRQIDIFDFHRIEPVVLFRNDPRPKNVMFHQDMAAIRTKGCDIAWRHAPWLYERTEKWLLPNVSHMFCVRQSAVDRYRETYPALAERFSFTPTWLDTDLFYPIKDPSKRQALRQRISELHGIPKQSRIVIFIGRLDHQKDPLLLLDAIGIAAQTQQNLHTIVVGDGSLRGQVEARIQTAGLQGKVSILGARPPAEIADLLRAADLLVMSSAYEGMPIVMLEALATGTPVVATNVGEINRAVRTGTNGVVVNERTAPSLAEGITYALANLESLRGTPCEDAVTPYYPERVLSGIYENHRRQAPGA